MLLDKLNHVLSHLVVMRSFFRGFGSRVSLFEFLGHCKADSVQTPELANDLEVLLDGEQVRDGKGVELFEDGRCQAPDRLLVQYGKEDVLKDLALGLKMRLIDIFRCEEVQLVALSELVCTDVGALLRRHILHGPKTTYRQRRG